MKEQGLRIFHKCVNLFEERFRLKVKNAVLIIETDNGEVEYVYRDGPTTLLLLNKVANKRLRKLVLTPIGSRIIQCDNCFGTGETTDGHSLFDCKKCNGGGEMVLMEPVIQGQNLGDNLSSTQQ